MEHWSAGVMGHQYPSTCFAPSFPYSISPSLQFFLGPVAQLVEQLTLNQLAEGSSPSRPTRNIQGFTIHGNLFFFLRGIASPSWVMHWGCQPPAGLPNDVAQDLRGGS
jgi:hypothetical protein